MKSNSYLDSLTRIAWAYLFLFLNLSANSRTVSVNLFPDWIGWLLIFQALPAIEKEERTAALLRPVVVLLGIFDAVNWTASLFTGKTLSLPLLQLIASVLTLYFHFQFLTDLASVASAHDLPRFSARLLHMRTAATLCSAVLSVLYYIGSLDALSGILLFFLIGVSLILAVWFPVSLFSFRNEERRRMFYRSSDAGQPNRETDPR